MNKHTRNATKKPGFWNNSSDLSVDKENAGSMSSIKKLSHKTTGKWKLTSINQWCHHKHNKLKKMDTATGSGLMEEYDLMKQPKYRVYMSNIDKALKNFEYSSEWADLISALGKLNKVISSNSQYQIIPRRIKISKRLAQCMHPALPSGVHLKALESYDVIFSNTGVERLASELFIYSAGLFPLLGYAAMNVRPSLLAIYEKYFVPLGERLRPALSGFLSGVLPGLEAGLDHFERTNSLLGKVCTAVSPIYFYTCLWECVATNSSIRLPAITYVLDHFNKRLGMSEQTYLMGTNVELMMSGLCACLNDVVILVQRNTLEFLLLGFPLHTRILAQSDIIKLVTNGINTILRRDMSLNRRLYSWLLGTEVKNSNRILMEVDLNENASLNSASTSTDSSSVVLKSSLVSYFEQYSKHILIKALKMAFKESLRVETKIDLRPYKILLSLLDKIEIGPVVLDSILCDVIRTISLSNGNVEVTKSVNTLFGNFDPSYIWNFMTNLYENACKVEDSSMEKRQLNDPDFKFTPEVDSGEPSLIEVCFLTEFLLETISLEMYNETTRVYLPRVLFAITKILTIYANLLTEDEITASLKLCLKIVSRVQPMILTPSKKTKPKETKSEESAEPSSPGVTFVDGMGSNLEKSKSDSKLNQSSLDDEPIKRSSSNHSMGKKSPKKSKKSKSYSKLLELDKEICSDSGVLSLTSSAVSTPNLEVQDKLKNKKKLSPTAKMKSKFKKSSEELREIEKEKELNDSKDSDDTVKSEPMIQIIPDTPTIEKFTPTALQEYTILEKCIKQYEIFYQIYLAHKLLNISHQKVIDIEKCPVRIELVSDESCANNNKLNYFLNDNLIEDHIGGDAGKKIDALFETLKIEKNCRLEKLQTLLNQTISEQENTSVDETKSKPSKQQNNENLKMINKLIGVKLSEPMRRSIKFASNLLVEMSTFPNYDQNLGLDYMETELPHWLKVLALTAAYSKSDKELQIASIQTVFEMISLLKSQMERSTNPGVQYVVMLPLLKFGHVSYLEKKTRIFQVLVSCLWDYLDGDWNVDLSLICSLLYQLHQCLDSGLVERVISDRIENSHLSWSASELVDSDLENNDDLLSTYKLERLSDLKIMLNLPEQLATSCSSQLTEKQSNGFKKFELLWHLGRDLQHSKSFEHILLKVYDNLALPHHISIRTFVVKWLKESLLRGDLSRLLKPLLKVMLCPNTKRISISNMHLLSLKGNRKDDNQLFDEKLIDQDTGKEILIEKDVYAVSSEDGNVRYHLESIHKKKSPMRSLPKKLFGIGNSKHGSQQSSKISTNYVTDKNYILPSNAPAPQSLPIESDLSSISLIINPMDQERNSADFENKNAPESLEKNKKRFSETSSEYSSTSCDSMGESSNEQSDNEGKKLKRRETQLKKYSGNFEADLKTDKVRTKNRKAYNLSHRALRDVGNYSEHPSFDESIAADEYFDKITTHKKTEELVENVVRDIVESAMDQETIESMMEKDLEQEDNPSILIKRLSKTSIDTHKSNVSEGSTTNRESTSEHESEINKESHSPTGAISKIQHKKRKHLKLGHVRGRKITQETLDKGKINVEILKKNFENDDFETQQKKLEKLHPFHTHLLLYYRCYDTKQVLYSFETLRNLMLSSDCKLFLCLSITTSVSNSQIKHLLMRHRKSIFAKGFDGSLTNTEFNNAYRGVMYLEVLITLCLYYARSYFQLPEEAHSDSDDDEAAASGQEPFNPSHEKPKKEDLIGNCKIQLASIELLTMIFNELIGIVKEMGRGLANYVADLMAKCKVQKVILHCVLTSVHYFTMKNNTTTSERILKFNDPSEEKMQLEAIQVQLLRLLHAVIKLENEAILQKGEDAGNMKEQSQSSLIATSASSPSLLSQSPTRPSPIIGGTGNVKYIANLPISQQPMFLTAILNALQSENLKHLHKNWTDLVTSSLGCFSFGSLTNIVISVMHQLCGNIDKITRGGLNLQMPPDYCVAQLEALTVICHYCLLDNSQQVSLSNIFNPTNNNFTSQSSSSGQFSNILNFFLASSSLQFGETMKQNSQQMATRNCVLSHLPRIIASVAMLWETDMGQGRLVKQQLMEFLSPISLHHGCNFLAAISVAWQERGDRKITKAATPSIEEMRSKDMNSGRYLPQAGAEQLSLVKLVSGIRIMPMDSFVQTLHSVIKSPPQIYRPPPGLVLDVSALELFYFYMKSAPAPQLADSWNSLLNLLKDGLILAPPAQFVLLSILNEFVQRCPQMPFQDKKDLRDLHDITSRLVDTISIIAGSCLEQTTWLRRNLAVKEETNGDLKDGNVINVGNQQYSVQAQSILAVILAPLLDVAYGSQEKDKVIQIVTTLMYNIVPYLKNHTVRNIPSFYACSNLLSSMSSYQYTRKAWRKDVFDLLLDSTFFQMDFSCLPFWKSILDNLMTYDNITFRELMTRLSVAQTGSLNIFTSKEQEYEQKALLLKKLAFVIFCSEKDQYQKYMPEIQEQLANSLRLPQVVPSVQAAVFLCFRVLLLRMSPDHVTSLWPTIIAEMVQVFLAIEQELMTDTEEFSQHIRMLSGLDTAWVTNTNNGLHSHGHPHWRMVQLETAKLLELGCVLPATILPHFQMYRWAFVGSHHDYCSSDIVNGGDNHELNNQTTPLSRFIPHVTRIAQLMDFRYTSHSPSSINPRGNHLVLNCQSISCLQDLYGFFSTLCIRWPASHFLGDPEKDVKNCLTEIEQVLSMDFLEKMPIAMAAR